MSQPKVRLPYLSPAAALARTRVPTPYGRTAPPPLAGLPPRLRQTFALLGRDLPVEEIARIMGISAKTVRAHLERLKLVLKLPSLPELRTAARLAHHPAVPDGPVG